MVKNIPEAVAFKLNNDDLIHHLSQAQSHLDWLSDYFSKQIIPSLKKEIKKLSKKEKMIEYTDFTIDEAPIFRKEDPIQLSFEDIARQALKDGRPLTPIKRRSDKPFTFEGVCPHCGAPKEYIYDNNCRGQYICKACKGVFTLRTTISEEAGI